MPKQQDEIDRLMRIRDRQLDARDPLAKEKQFHIFVGMALGRLVGAAVDWRSDDWSRRR